MLNIMLILTWIVAFGLAMYLATRAIKFRLHVAVMLHGVAGSDWEPLKRKGNCCDMMQHQGGCDWKLSH